ncbi:MAG: phospholipase D family protein [Kiloniellales bacterium]
MRLLFIVLAAVAAFSLASFLALYSYGRFAERAQGEPSTFLPVADNETPLDSLVAPLVSERPDQSGLMLLEGNLDAFAIRALSARRAGRSLDLQYYIWKGDLTGRLLANEIVKAADRGVRVRVLLDDINAQGHDKAHLTLDAHPNIAIRLFNPSRNRDDALRRGVEMLLRAIRVTRRMHNKAWIADGRLAVVGGRNIGDAYFDADSNANFRDLDLLALGAAVRQAEGVFDDFWNSSAVIPIGALGALREMDLPALRHELASLTADERARPYLDRVAEDESVREMLSGERPFHWTSQARIVSDPPAKSKGMGQENWLINVIAPALNSAKSDLEIVSPYFIPGETGTSALVEMAQRGVKVAVLTNSLAATDVTAVHGAYAQYRKPIIEAGVGLFELKPYDDRSENSLFGSSGASLHTKAFTVDGRAGFIGSMNFDPRSISLNSEMGVLFEHAGLVAEVREIFADETSPQKSYRVGLDDGEIVWQDRSAGAVRTLREEPEAGVWRQLAATIIGLLPIQSQL